MVDPNQKFSKTFYSSKQGLVPNSQMFTQKKDYRKQLRAGSRGDPIQKSLDSAQFQEISKYYQFNLFNPMVDENLLGSQLKVEAIHIQEEINKIDSDGILRAAQGIGFGKPYINSIKKWLATNSSINAKELIDIRCSTPLDTEKIVEILNVKSESEGLKKLFKLLGVLDVLASKIAELEMITFLKYEENFAALVKKPIPSTSSIHSLSAGIQLNRFQTSQINIERNIELFNIANKLSTSSKPNFPSKTSMNIANIQSLEELISAINSNTFQMNEDFSEVILKHLNEYQALQTNYEKIRQKHKNEIKDLQDQIQSSKEAAPKEVKTEENSKDSTYYIKLIDDVTNQCKEEKDRVEALCTRLNQQCLDLQIKQDRLTQQLQEQSKEMQDIISQKQKLQLSAQHSYKNSKEYVEGYESALREELQNMKKGYEALIEELHDNIDKIKKQKGQELLDMKRDLTRENETKRLLLKKLNVFLKI